MPEQNEEPLPPVVVDLGGVRRKRIKELKQGRGRLVEEVQQVVETVQRDLGEEAEGKEILPVVILYRRKPKRRKKGLFGW